MWREDSCHGDTGSTGEEETFGRREWRGRETLQLRRERYPATAGEVSPSLPSSRFLFE